MTESKHLKERIRERMARTGERYTTARRHVVGAAAGVPAPSDDHGWRLRGGLHPDTAAIANVLAHHGASVSEAMVLGAGGGLGAGYILWEFDSLPFRSACRSSCTRPAGNAGPRRGSMRRWPPGGPRWRPSTARGSATGSCRRTSPATAATRSSSTAATVIACASTTATSRR